MYRVIEHFCDLQDNGFSYHPGDKFPRDGFEVSKARIKELSGRGNRLGTALIKPETAKPDEAEELKAEEPKAAEKPKKRARRAKE